MHILNYKHTTIVPILLAWCVQGAAMAIVPTATIRAQLHPLAALQLTTTPMLELLQNTEADRTVFRRNSSKYVGHLLLSG